MIVARQPVDATRIERLDRYLNQNNGNDSEAIGRLRILHASDLHWSDSDHIDQEVVARALLKDVAESGQEVDLLVFSGALAHSGKDSELKGGRELLLDPIMKQLRLGPDRVVLVPGNHDVDRGAINEYTEIGLAKSLTNRDSVNDLIDSAQKLATASERLHAWKALMTSFYEDVEITSSKDLGWYAERHLRGTRVGIAGLNSAWRSAGIGESEKGQLVVGDHQLQAMMPTLNDCQFRLVVVHHPFDWLASFDSDDLRREVERGGALVLSGH